MANRGSNYCQHLNTIPVPADKIMLHKCKNCDDSIFGLGSCVKCNDCPENYFHQICLKPTLTLTHPFYPSVRYKFSHSPDNNERRRCVACYQNNITGYHYVGSNQTYIHPYCLVSLKASATNSTINLHKQALTELLDSTKSNKGYKVNVSSNVEMDCEMHLSPKVKCIICNEEDTKEREFGWVFKYKCRSKKLECHIACLRKGLVNNGLNKICMTKQLPETSRVSYFLELPITKWEKSLLTIADLSLPVAVVGLDMMISAFVGVPLVSILLAVALEIASDKVESHIHRRLGGSN